MKNRCTSCGTTNWADAKVCIRCSRSLDALVELTGLERLEAQSDRKEMPLGGYIMMGLVAFFVVFVGIKLVTDGRAEAARIEAKKKADAEQANQMLWAVAEAAANKKMLENAKAAMNPQGPNPGHFDTYMKQQPTLVWDPNHILGGYQIPPPGTVYEHRNGQMHQIR